jgi:hypothetical protein
MVWIWIDWNWTNDFCESRLWHVVMKDLAFWETKEAFRENVRYL